MSKGTFGLIGISLAFGIVVSAMIYVFGDISGSHVNHPSPLHD
jgi:aquaporin Z